MITDLPDPIIEAFKVRFDNGDNVASPSELKRTFSRFMDTLPTTLAKNPDGAPTMLVVDSTLPMSGLSSIGHEAMARLTATSEPGVNDFSDLQDGDVIFFQARPREYRDVFDDPELASKFYTQPVQDKRKTFQGGGGSIALGQLRNLVYAEAVDKELLPRNLNFNWLWVTEFPMFTPDNADSDPGQGGVSGFSATHHPFTAPLTVADFELLAKDPLRARADHYDLVVNGVELGGGSRRIHVAGVQEYVFRSILGMNESGVQRFAHLLEALRAGCPPHAGFALGFDRLVAMLSHTDSVRDVIAFPKSMKGEDLMVNSPGVIGEDVMETYGFRVVKSK
jgi:aspartyl-tRNA synthetase